MVVATRACCGAISKFDLHTVVSGASVNKTISVLKWIPVCLKISQRSSKGRLELHLLRFPAGGLAKFEEPSFLYLLNWSDKLLMHSS